MAEVAKKISRNRSRDRSRGKSLGRSDNSSLEYVKRTPSPASKLKIKKTMSEPLLIQIKETPKKVLPVLEKRKKPDKNCAFAHERLNMFASGEYEPFENFKSLAIDERLDRIDSNESE